MTQECLRWSRVRRSPLARAPAAREAVQALAQLGRTYVAGRHRNEATELVAVAPKKGGQCLGVLTPEAAKPKTTSLDLDGEAEGHARYTENREATRTS